MTAPRARPILFSGPMVRAILAGKKTQTRRPMAPQPACNCRYEMNGAGTKALHLSGPREALIFMPVRYTSTDHRLPSPFGTPGDRLWVRETWQFADWTLDGEPFIGYRADDAQELRYPDSDEWGERLANIWADLSADGRQPAADLTWRPSIHMPRWASRLTLEVTGLRVERLQEISEADAESEGAGHCETCNDSNTNFLGDDTCPANCGGSSNREEFERVWEGVYGSRSGLSWADNPFVWVVEFRRVEVAP